MPFFPVRPGLALDVDVFVRLRARMRETAVEGMGMAGVRDDAVSLALLGLEAHVKAVLEGGARVRAARTALRPHGGVVCAPVRGADLREAGLRNAGLLGEDAGLDLERLALLQF
jgi:hypothetical protein